MDEPKKEEEVKKEAPIAMALLCPSLPSPNCRLFRRRSSNISSKYHKELMIARSGVSTRSISSEEGLSRRDLVLIGLSSPLSMLLPLSPVTYAEEDLKMVAEELKVGSMVDDVNAYSYAYPLELPSEKLVFKWVESRKPERYSSAAPLSPDARLRIVSERVDLIDNLVISISIGPPNSTLKSKEKNTWAAKEVADSVLSDKSALRVTSSQRLEESSVLDAHATDIDGEPYWYYEYLVRKSPTKIAEASKLYRHYISSTAERDGYLYTINASTLGKQWDKMGPVLERTVESFRLLPATDSYVPPYKDPWRFW
ncbi:PREDICTED: psbP domain-containing protein 5, chloroplastic isoform X2 [Camelina sativa]|uniref:PsbP domain-containing protein 5, chloroplastic isoform X2 n=1 Tax=Camelina sativa TaxID=90675 RepID=A0ABM0XW55_CAMSA|nr:PREDICTED: psbP domain-containing protein 5, chloroplastic isoform X2 [Camelina sativa]